MYIQQCLAFARSHIKWNLCLKEIFEHQMNESTKSSGLAEMGDWLVGDTEFSVNR